MRLDLFYRVCYNRNVNDLLEKTARRLGSLRGKKLVIGVSGGRDSTCLLHAVVHCGAIDRSNVTAVHINHCLREQADSDERFVKRFCESIGVKFRAFRVNVKKESAENGLTVEQAARNLRYDAFYDLIKNGEADCILTAHHALDNAETVLMHMFRGAGLDGLRGMSATLAPMPSAQACGDGIGAPAENDLCASALPLVRPFIDVYPTELDDYCKLNGLEYVVDETNSVDDADRNFIRLNVIPLIEQRYKGAVRAINALSRECVSACEILDGALDPTQIRNDSGAVVISADALSGAFAARYVRDALGRFSPTDITREQIVRTAELINMRTGATAELSNGLVAVREYDGVAVYVRRLECDGEIPFALGKNTLDGLTVTAELSDRGCTEMRGGAVDLDKLDGAVLRFRRDGDVFTPFGGKRKKLKQYFIDSKIPKRKRDRLPLVCRGNEVLVIVGVQISDRVKQTERTVNKAVIYRSV